MNGGRDNSNSSALMMVQNFSTTDLMEKMMSWQLED